jgi:hypothetical protein
VRKESFPEINFSKLEIDYLGPKIAYDFWKIPFAFGKIVSNIPKIIF